MSYTIEGSAGTWEIVCGLEVHAQVVSETKLFSGAATTFGATANSQVSPVDAEWVESLIADPVEDSGRRHRGALKDSRVDHAP